MNALPDPVEHAAAIMAEVGDVNQAVELVEISYDCASRIEDRAYWARVKALATRGSAILVTVFLLMASAGVAAQDRIATPAYWSAVTVTAALTAADGYTTIHIVQNNPLAFERGTPWLYGRRPTPARVTIGMSGQLAAGALGSYLLKRHGFRHVWIAPLAFVAISHGRGMAINIPQWR